MKDGQNANKNTLRPIGVVQSAKWTDSHKRTPFLKQLRQSTVQITTQTSQEQRTEAKPGSNRALIQSKDNVSFNRKVLRTVESVGHEQVNEARVPGYLVTLEQVTKEATNGLKLYFASEYRHLTVWDDIRCGLDHLHSVWTKMKEAVSDLRVYVHVPMIVGEQSLDHMPSVDSLTDEPSFIEGQELCISVLTRIIREAHDVFQPYFINVLQLISLAFREEDNIVRESSVTGISIATRAIRLLGMLKELEHQMRSVKDDRCKFEFAPAQRKERTSNVEALFDEMCRHLESVQRGFFQSKYLYVRGHACIQKVKGMAEVIRNCWKESTLLVRHLRKICPELKETIYKMYSHVLCRAGTYLAEMQDSHDLQAYLTQSEPIPYDDQVLHDMVHAQLQLLPCLNDIIEFSSYLSQKIRSRCRDAERDSTVAHLIPEMKDVLYNVVMMAIARASWLISWTVRSSSPNLQALKEQGSQSLLLVYNYNKSDLSIRCSASSPKEDMPLYAEFVYRTNTLRNGVIQVHGMICKEAAIAVALGDTSSPFNVGGEFTEQQTTDIQFHRVAGLETLVPQFSLRTFPIDLAVSQELESSTDEISQEVVIEQNTVHENEELGTETTIASNENVTSNRNDDHLSHRSDLDLINGPVSSFSLDLPNEFETEHSVEEDTSHDEIHHSVTPQLQVLIPANIQNNDEMPRMSPFAANRPESEMPTPVRNNGSFNSPNTDLYQSTTSTHPLRRSSNSSTSSSSSSQEDDVGVRNVLPTELVGSVPIGRGAGGTVFKMSFHPRPVAVKIMNDKTMQPDRFKREMRIHRHLSTHPNIVQFVGSYHPFHQQLGGINSSNGMVMELCELGDLFKILLEARWIRDRNNFGRDISEYETSSGYLLYSDWALRVQVARDIAAGVAHMHRNGIVHRDLTSYNIVMKNGQRGQWTAKVCDFERSREVPGTGFVPRSDTLANSPAWAAPEILDSRDYSIQADVYSMGVILWELFTLGNPNELEIDYFRREGEDFHEERRNMLLDEFVKCCDSTFPYYNQLAEVLKQCLNEDGQQRPTMNELHDSLLNVLQSMTIDASTSIGSR
eukprot:g5136.t1